ncbi:MAG: hypothetical protein IKV85_06440 [Ruminococcus sp.]|nr:hypothetical protein [Ruminococcus sp.]
MKCGEDFYETDSDYVIHKVNGELYRFEYNTQGESEITRFIITVNLFLGIMTIIILAVMLYLRRKILNPFEQLSDVPYELSKGNLTTPVKEMKNRFFGRFIWGVDMLRENIEQQKKRELDLQRDRKMLLSVTISEEEGCILVTVRNSGCTLHDTDLPHILTVSGVVKILRISKAAVLACTYAASLCVK